MLRSSAEPIRTAVILTALELEHASVMEHLSPPIAEHTERGLIFTIGTLAGRHPWRVAVAQVGAGSLPASVALERAIATFAPEVAMFVGIAGGRRDVAHADVVAADAVYDYETGKDAEHAYLPRIKTLAPSFALVQRAAAVARDDRWPDRIGPPRPRRRPQAFVKPVATGNKVVAHDRSATAALLANYCGDALAIDMESYGFLHGAYVNQNLATLVVRGISDLLSDKTTEHDQRWQVPAARSAAAFAVEVLGTLASSAAVDRAEISAPQPRGGTRFSQTNSPTGNGVVYANQGTGNQIITIADRGAP